MYRALPCWTNHALANKLSLSGGGHSLFWGLRNPVKIWQVSCTDAHQRGDADLVDLLVPVTLEVARGVQVSHVT